MNEILGFYLVFATTTALVGIFKIFYPLMTALAEIRPSHNMIDYKFISYTAFFGLMWLCAPITLIAVLVPSSTKEFIDSMLQAIITEEAA